MDLHSVAAVDWELAAWLLMMSATAPDWALDAWLPMKSVTAVDWILAVNLVQPLESVVEPQSVLPSLGQELRQQLAFVPVPVPDA